MFEQSQRVAVTLGFISIQFNLVVSTNQSAIRLWNELGSQAIGTLPKSFNSLNAGYVFA